MLPVEQQLAQLYAALGEYLKLKARLFEPVRGIDLDERRLALALHNGRVVDALNASKEAPARPPPRPPGAALAGRRAAPVLRRPGCARAHQFVA